MIWSSCSLFPPLANGILFRLKLCWAEGWDDIGKMLPTLYYAAILSFHVPWVAASYWLYSSRVLIELFYWWVLVKLFSLVCVWKGVGDKGWELVVCHLADITWHAVLKCNFVFGCRHLDFYLDYSLGLLKYVSPLSHSSFLLMWDLPFKMEKLTMP